MLLIETRILPVTRITTIKGMAVRGKITIRIMMVLIIMLLVLFMEVVILSINVILFSKNEKGTKTRIRIMATEDQGTKKIREIMAVTIPRYSFKHSS